MSEEKLTQCMMKEDKDKLKQFIDEKVNWTIAMVKTVDLPQSTIDMIKEVQEEVRKNAKAVLDKYADCEKI